MSQYQCKKCGKYIQRWGGTTTKPGFCRMCALSQLSQRKRGKK